MAQYLVSTSLIVCGILSAVQITRFHIYKTPYCLGTGLIGVVGTPFAIIPVATRGLAQMYNNGVCPAAADGTRLPCPDRYGALLGAASLCALLEIELSFMTPNLLKRLFPPIITGSTVALIGVSLIQSALEA
jgi:uric acid-xanthine permease